MEEEFEKEKKKMRKKKIDNQRLSLQMYNAKEIV
jgi:hypothetical protein